MIRSLSFCFLLFLMAGCNDPVCIYNQELHVPEGENIVASHQSGFFDAPFRLELRPENDSLYIRFTLDGTFPDETAPIYSCPIYITGRNGPDALLACLPTTPLKGKWQLDQFRWKYPQKVPRASVIRYRCYDGYGTSSGKTYTQTFFVGKAAQTRFSVVSLVTEPGHLFDDDDGIFVPGIHYSPERWTDDWWPPGNYRQRGREWERKVWVQMFDEKGRLGFETPAGLRLNGQAIAAFPQKSLRFSLRNDYGNRSIEYPLLENYPARKFKKFLLRNSGNDCFSTLFRDAFLHEVIREMDVESQRYRSALLYINGEYWGVYNFRNRLDKHFFNDHFQLEKDEIDLLEGFHGAVVLGDDKVYREMMALAKAENLENPENYARMMAYLDVNNFIDYHLIQTYFANYDWPANNVKCWRPRTKNGRFRWLVFDLDFCAGFNLMGAASTSDFDAIAHATEKNSTKWNNGHGSTLLFRAMMESPEFRKKLVCRYRELVQTVFNPEHLHPVLADFEARYAVEIPKHSKRWGYPENIREWEEQVQIIRDFIAQRPAFFQQHLEAYLGTALSEVCPENSATPFGDHGKMP